MGHGKMFLLILGVMALFGTGIYLGGYLQRLVLEAEVEATRAELNEEPMCETFLIMKPDMIRGYTYVGLVDLCGRDQFWIGSIDPPEEPEPEFDFDNAL